LTLSSSRIRFSRLPPYWSVRRLLKGERDSCSREAWAAWTSRTRKPAARARRGAGPQGGGRPARPAPPPRARGGAAPAAGGGGGGGREGGEAAVEARLVQRRRDGVALAEGDGAGGDDGPAPRAGPPQDGPSLPRRLAAALAARVGELEAGDGPLGGDEPRDARQ